MINLFNKGDEKQYQHVVTDADIAAFKEGIVHPVYATFALGRDAEWCCRLFVLEMKEADEEGIGTFLTIQHHAPAMLGSTVLFTAKVKSINGNEIICTYEAKQADRLIASGEQGQKIVKKEKLDHIFQQLAQNG
jgi:fluoroacetyl-CoA thioesterase